MENMSQSPRKRPRLLAVKSLPQMQPVLLPQPSVSAPPAVSPSWQCHHESPSHDLRNISDGPLHAASCVQLGCVLPRDEGGREEEREGGREGGRRRGREGGREEGRREEEREGGRKEGRREEEREGGREEGGREEGGREKKKLQKLTSIVMGSPPDLPAILPSFLPPSPPLPQIPGSFVHTPAVLLSDSAPPPPYTLAFAPA